METLLNCYMETKTSSIRMTLIWAFNFCLMSMLQSSFFNLQLQELRNTLKVACDEAKLLTGFLVGARWVLEKSFKLLENKNTVGRLGVLFSGVWLGVFLAKSHFQLNHLVKTTFGQSRVWFSRNSNKIFSMFMFPKIKNKPEQNAQNKTLCWNGQTRLVFCCNTSGFALCLGNARQLRIPTSSIGAGDAPSVLSSDLFTVLLTAAIPI